MRQNKGFSLVELIIVVAIIGILAGVVIAVVNPNTQLQKARDSGRKTALKNLQNALEQYYTDNGVYPVLTCTSNNTTGCWSTTGAGRLFGANAANYIKIMPTDPIQTGTNCTTPGNKVYGYYSAAPGTSYLLTTRLENLSDASIVPGQPNAYDSASDGGVCTIHNYKLVNQQ